MCLSPPPACELRGSDRIMFILGHAGGDSTCGLNWKMPLHTSPGDAHDFGKLGIWALIILHLKLHKG